MAAPRAKKLPKRAGPRPAVLKTRPTAAGVVAFLDAVADPVRREDARALLTLMSAQTGVEPRMWGDSIVGFGDVHLKYASGRELDWFACGFSPRKDGLSLYGLLAADRSSDPLLARLGSHRTGKGCLYVKKLADVDTRVLAQLVRKVARRS